MGGQHFVTFDYKARAWQREALAGMNKHRFSIIVAHRRAGKTEVQVIQLLTSAISLNREHPAPMFAYVAPFLNQAKGVAWDRLKYYARPFTLSGKGRTDETELSLKLWNGSTIRLFGADYPDRLRGFGFDGVVMDEVAQMKPETWPSVIRPALSDRKGWAAFIGTPKGRNVFYTLYQDALKKEDWYTGSFPVSRTNVFDQAEIDGLVETMPMNAYRQEYMCDFSADNDNTFILSEELDGAISRPKPLINPAPLVMGLDVARFGDDRTVLVRRRGMALEGYDVWTKADLMYTSSRTAELMARYRPQAVFVDAIGVGGGVVDHLKSLGHRVIGVNAGGLPVNVKLYSNLKAEMWGKVREWLSTAIMPNDEALKNDLLAPVYEYDAYGKLKIESKAKLKARGVASTDIADALALTFAQPVAAIDYSADMTYGGRPKFCIM